MKKVLTHIFEIGCSGIIGVLLTLGFQYFFPQQQEFTFVINGEKVSLTEPQLQEQLYSTQEKLNTAEEELNTLKKQSNNVSTIEYSDFSLNINGESKGDYKNGYVDIDGKKYILYNVLNELLNEEIKYENNILYIGHSSAEVVNLMDVCAPYDVSSTYLYNTDPFKMSGIQYTNGFTMQSPDKYYALINLNEKFSELEFDFGHVDGSGDFSATVNIFLDGNLVKTIEKNADEYVSHESVNLNYAKQLKIEINTGHAGYFGEYGFGNMVLTY